MDCYKIIHDEKALVKFIKWLPDLKESETYYLCLFARKKYYNPEPEEGDVKSNNATQLKRFISNKEKLIDKIQQLEIPIGRYKLKDGIVPQEALALYIMPNPRCMKKATELMGKKCWDLYKNNNFNLHQEALSCIQASKSYTYVVDFDIDSKDIDLNKLNDILPQGSYEVLETRGGYHILVNPKIPTYNINGHNMEYWSNWHQKITKEYKVDKTGDQLIPVTGTIQGGYMPKFIKI